MNYSKLGMETVLMEAFKPRSAFIWSRVVSGENIEIEYIWIKFMNNL